MGLEFRVLFSLELPQKGRQCGIVLLMDKIAADSGLDFIFLRI